MPERDVPATPERTPEPTPEPTPRQLVHDLRNRLGSLLLNAEVLIAWLPPEARDAPSVRHAVEDGRRCAALIMQIEALFDPD